MDFFYDNESTTNIIYVVAKYNNISKKWFEQYEYDEIEEAYTKMNECKNYHKTSVYGVFEKIKTECINQIHDSYLERTVGLK